MLAGAAAAALTAGERSAAPAASATPTPSATPTATPTPSAPATVPTATATPAAPGGDAIEREAVERAVEGHWQLIAAGRYADAYAGFTPAFQARTSRRGWIRAHAADRLSDVRVVVRARIAPTRTAATAAVVSLRTMAASGCFTWTGSYDLQRIGGVWRIAGSHLERRPCT